MAWNGSGQTNSQVVERKPVSKKCRRFPVALKASVLVLALGIAAALLWPESEEPIEMKAPSARPVVVTNQQSVAKVDTPVSTNAVAKRQLSPIWQKFYDGRDTNKWIVVKDPITGKERLNRKVSLRRPNQPPPLYRSRALNVLDALAFRPAMSAMLNPRIDAKFRESFQEGLLEGIEILPTDSDDVKFRKQGMIELRKELAQRLKAGENIETIVREEIKERNALANYRHQMQIEYGKLKREGEDPALVEAFGEKCNEILEEKGGAPIMTQKRMEEIFGAQK